MTPEPDKIEVGSSYQDGPGPMPRCHYAWCRVTLGKIEAMTFAPGNTEDFAKKSALADWPRQYAGALDRGLNPSTIIVGKATGVTVRGDV